MTKDNIAKHFNGAKLNVGVQLGPNSKGLTDIDLDCDEAIQLAPYFLPKTPAMFGRKSKATSHLLYTIDDAPTDKAVLKLTDKIGKDAKGIVELRMGGGSKGAQTVFPGSTHESGEIIEWVCDETPTHSDYATLKLAVTKIAVGTILRRNWPGRSGHAAALALGGFLARAGWSPDDIEKFVHAIAPDKKWKKDSSRTAKDSAEAHAKGENVQGFPGLCEQFGEEPAKAIAKILDYGSDLNQSEDLYEMLYGEGGELKSDDDAATGTASMPTPPIQRSVIQIKADGLSINSTQAQRLLKAAGVKFFERGGLLVRPITKEVTASEGQKTKVAQLQQVDTVYMRDMLARVIKWERWDVRKGKWVPTNPPFEIASTILGRNGEWPFPTIDGVITTPTMRPDGSLLLTPGYDKATRLLLVSPPKLPTMPDQPTRDDALTALALLEDLLEEFPFDNEISQAVALSALITPVVRGAFMMTPGHSAKAATPSSGKSYLFDIVAAIAIGQYMPVIAAGRNEEETEKRMGSALMAGQPLISIDNVNGELGGDALCQYLERPSVEIRMLGLSKLITVEARGTSIFATGNNITLRGDIVRRVITTTIDPKMERPELREFKKKPREMVLENRGQYIAACLTICRAHVVAGRPFQVVPLGSYEGWSNTVRSALKWLGKADPVDSMETTRKEDPELIRRQNMLTAWAVAIGIGFSSRCTMAKAVHTAKQTSSPGTPQFSDLRDAMAAVAPRKGDNIDPDDPIDNDALGRWLRSNNGKIVDGVRFTNKTSEGVVISRGSPVWWIEHRDGEQAGQRYREQCVKQPF
ncbi:bifunctional DNA primase/polymerase [Bradyrhizobium erythrophlei]|uniref:bifunctional DNA primase/polymerase n=1 Tax=Bradyrhizobium erythrophlei TaxID=1437360 RepID=UPI001FCD769E